MFDSEVLFTVSCLLRKVYSRGAYVTNIGLLPATPGAQNTQMIFSVISVPISISSSMRT